MKILRVISSMNPKSGGPAQGIRNAIPHIQKLGILNDVICLDEENMEYGTTDDFTIHKVGKGKTAYQYQPILLEWLSENMTNYDVVLVHGLWQYHNLAVYKAIKKLKKQSKKAPKVVVLPHGMMDPYFQTAPDRKWRALRNEMVWHSIEKKCINAADAIFYTCQEEMHLAATTFKGYAPQKAVNVGYGIQAPPENTFLFEKAFHQMCSAVANKKYWLFLSRIHEKKGVDLLIKAYDALSKQNPALPELVIAGPNQSAFAQEMMQLAAVNPKIHFPGMLQGEAKWGAFYNCEAYLLASHQENFGIAIVEAMACKKAVMISKHINIWKEIEAGKGGWILEDLSQEAIADQLAVIAALSDQALHHKGEQAFETYQNKFDVQQCATVFVNALKDL